MSGLSVVETDDLLGFRIGDRFLQCVVELRKRFTFGKWVDLQKKSCDYGGRTLKQNGDSSVNISMTRSLQEQETFRLGDGSGGHRHARSRGQVDMDRTRRHAAIIGGCEFAGSQSAQS